MSYHVWSEQYTFIHHTYLHCCAADDACGLLVSVRMAEMLAGQENSPDNTASHVNNGALRL